MGFVLGLSHKEKELGIRGDVVQLTSGGVITITHSGYIKSLPLDTYRRQSRGGRGVMGMETKEEDYVEIVSVTTNHAFVLFFTNRGKVYRVKAYDVPEARPRAPTSSTSSASPRASGSPRSSRSGRSRTPATSSSPRPAATSSAPG